MDATKHNQVNHLCVQACIFAFNLCLINDKIIKQSYLHQEIVHFNYFVVDLIELCTRVAARLMSEQ